MKDFGTIIGAILASEGFFKLFQFVIERFFGRKDRHDKAIDEMKEELCKRVGTLQVVVDIILYHTLADKLEYYLRRGWIDGQERQEIENLHKSYRERGFNGDMDSRMQAVYELPYNIQPGGK